MVPFGVVLPVSLEQPPRVALVLGLGPGYLTVRRLILFHPSILLFQVPSRLHRHPSRPKLTPCLIHPSEVCRSNGYRIAVSIPRLCIALEVAEVPLLYVSQGA